ERHTRHRTRHAALVAEIRGLLPGGPWGYGEMAPPHALGGLGGLPPRLTEPLSRSELRVLRYLPTNLTMPEIARELSVSHNTASPRPGPPHPKSGPPPRPEPVAPPRPPGLPPPARTSLPSR